MLFTFNFILTFSCIKLLKDKNFWSVSSILLLSILAMFNQFGLMILIFLLLYFWKILDINISDKKIIITLSLILIINFIFWYTFGILTKNWYVLFDDFSSFSIWGVTKRLLVGFLNYPDNYLTFLNYFRTIPLLTVVAGVTLLSLFLLLFLEKAKSDQIKFLFGAVIFLGLIAILPTLLYQETRYTFFLSPIVLLLALIPINKLFIVLIKRNMISNVGFVVAIMGVFILSKDFNLYHLLNIDKRDVNYRMIYNNYFKVHLYRRYDILTPTEFVKHNLNKEDIIMINENSLEYYLPRVDYFNFDYKHHAFAILTVERGKKERWSNAKLIYKHEDLINFIENRRSTIWYLVFPEGWLAEINFYEKYKENLVYKGVDGLVKVFKFPNERKK